MFFPAFNSITSESTRNIYCTHSVWQWRHLQQAKAPISEAFLDRLYLPDYVREWVRAYLWLPMYNDFSSCLSAS